MEIMRNSQSLHLFMVPFVFSLLSLLLCPASASSGSDYDYGGHPRFFCTPIPVDADPACFPTGGPSVGKAGPGGPGHQSAPPAGWWGASDEAKATILHLRESLVQQKETILDQRETIRELTAKLTLCEGLGRGATPHDEHHGTASHPHHSAGVDGHHTYTDNGHYGNQQGHHGDLIPDSPHHPSVGGQRADGGHGSNHHGKDKHVTPGDITSSPEQTERMLQALKERLDNLQQKRNTSITYSSSLQELLQRKISALEQQLHHRTSALSGPDHHDDHHDDHSRHRDDGEHHDDDRHDGDHHDDDHHNDNHHDDDHHHDRHPNDHDDDHNDGGHSGHSDHHDDSHNDDHHDVDSDHDDHDDRHHDDDDDDDDHHHDHHRPSNEADSHLSHTGYREPGPQTGYHANKLETILSQLHLAGSGRRKSKSPDAFQISFPMRTNYMYGRLKSTLMQEIFALTLCLWIKAGTGPGLGTPFSYSAPGQSNELVLIEWGNNPMELLIDDKAVTLPLSLADEKWHHICVTWSTRDGQWEAYQDGVQRGSGINLSPWHPIKPGGVFIMGQEQDTLGGRFDATQSFVGEISDVHMWSHVLTASDIYTLASCGSHLRGDVIAWSETEVELHGGVAKYPFDPCH
ncbi:neuronal pentraxin-1 isoform X1 [Sebastes umbrosus]|uniref:neuronal pentraxin-1 isoform X1 n=1 Tax=Sebastes umbrosus TaxID=72105 RepID=UPI00189D443A|nr:neuronal pentraxin-1 isoform X1 [Sebastes umbrosus]